MKIGQIRRVGGVEVKNISSKIPLLLVRCLPKHPFCVWFYYPTLCATSCLSLNPSTATNLCNEVAVEEDSGQPLAQRADLIKYSTVYVQCSKEQSTVIYMVQYSLQN